MSTVRRSVAVLTLAVLTLGTQACDPEETGSGSSDSSQAPSESDDTGSADDTDDTDDSESDDSGESDDADAGEPTGEDLEADFELFVDQITEFAEENDLPVPAEWNFLADGEEEDTACTDTDGNAVAADDTAYFYCPGDEEVYVGEATMQTFADEYGAVAPGVGIAHEWGHHLQTAAGVPSDTQDDVIAKENQADCVGGAWYRDLDRGVQVLEWAEIAEMFVMISELEGPDRTHGTILERTTSVAKGGVGGLEQCESFTDPSILDQ